MQLTTTTTILSVNYKLQYAFCLFYFKNSTIVFSNVNCIVLVHHC